MNENPIIITERVDDIPLLLEHMQRMRLPALLDHHFPTHGNWQGLSLGWVSTIWLSSILSRGDHRMVHVEPWVSTRLVTLGALTGQTVKRVDFTDDRLEAFQDITVTLIKTTEQTMGHVTALNPLQQRILELLGFSAELYMELGTVSLEPL